MGREESIISKMVKIENSLPQLKSVEEIFERYADDFGLRGEERTTYIRTMRAGRGVIVNQNMESGIGRIQSIGPTFEEAIEEIKRMGKK
ncbi:MAG: hypothetical protein UV56_C0006G0005 [Candidatus Woesebacteria bacterium GW2011_GWC1_43_10b]|uniref:Uncharacterized protein n=3 Tax=Candidatus Woeseibacteriota TaxID=1752722 RepID=A0A0G1C5M2_9BACT|nr:MAG: hypothetical protein UV56_C0006G0005 [Candidatus Woesebacteria bacterium GW2011_GWC1_43_10b]